jgi:hypothetical protein
MVKIILNRLLVFQWSWFIYTYEWFVIFYPNLLYDSTNRLFLCNLMHYRNIVLKFQIYCISMLLHQPISIDQAFRIFRVPLRTFMQNRGIMHFIWFSCHFWIVGLPIWMFTLCFFKVLGIFLVNLDDVWIRYLFWYPYFLIMFLNPHIQRIILLLILQDNMLWLYLLIWYLRIIKSIS